MTAGDRLEYDKRVNRVIDHIREQLAEELSVAGLARVAGFSPFHFHRVFKALTGETLFGFVQRLRLEKAAAALRDHPDASVLAIALDHGFASAATFARAFRARFGMSATAWRAGGAARARRRYWSGRKAGKPVRNAGKAARPARAHPPRRRSEEGPMSIQVRELPAQHVAYMRYVGPYGAHGIPELWQRLRRWMSGRDLGGAPRVTLGVAYDDPTITAPERCRYDACVVAPPEFTPDRSVDVMDVPGGTFATTAFVGTAGEIEGVWDRVFSAWLPDSGWEPDDRPCFELYRGDPTVDAGRGVFRGDLCLPVRRL